MIETLKDKVNGDAGLVRRGRYLTTTFLLEVGSTAWLISIYEGRIVAITRGPFVMPSSAFALRGAVRIFILPDPPHGPALPERMM